MILYRVRGLRGIVRRVQARLLTVAKPGFSFAGVPTIYGWPILRCVPGAEVVIGCNVVLISESVYSTLGLGHECLISAIKPGAHIGIGDSVGMSGATVCCAERILIGNRVLIGANAVVVDNDFHPVDAVARRYGEDDVAAAPVLIEDDVFIGMGAMILKGTHIGAGAVVGAGSVVTGTVPSGCIVAGAPARVVGHVSGHAQLSDTVAAPHQPT